MSNLSQRLAELKKTKVPVYVEHVGTTPYGPWIVDEVGDDYLVVISKTRSIFGRERTCRKILLFVNLESIHIYT